MPPVIAWAAAYITGAIVAIGGGTFTALGVATVVASTFSTLAYGLMLSSVMKALGPKKPKGAGRGLDQQLYDSVCPGRILFGQVRVGGAHVLPPIVTADYDLSGNNGGMRSHRVLAIAIHEIDSFVTTYGDQEEITNANIAAVTGAAYTDGRVTGGKFAPKGTSVTYLWIRRYAGTSTQAVDYFLNHVDGTAFSSTFRGRGIAYAAITYGWSGSGSGYMWQTGLPDITFTVKGMKCYDPRADSTNGGSGTQRYATPSTWVWSANPAVIAGTFLMFDEFLGGGGYDPATEIDWTTIAAAANICDALVNIPGATTQARYTGNLVLDASALFEDNLSDIIDCMLGRCIWRDGKWRVYAGAWDTATFTIEESDWCSPLTIQTIAPRREGRWNGVKCFYVDPARNYQRVECYPRTSQTYYEDDASDRIWLEIERAGTNSEYEAQRHAEFILRQSRNQIKLTGCLPPRFQYLAIWETGVINFASLGWSSKTFRLVSYKLNPDGSVDVGFSEEQSTDWTDLASGEYSSPSLATLPDSNVQQPDTPTSFTLAETIAGTLFASLTPGEVKPIGTTFQLYASPGTLWNSNSAQLVWEGDSNNAYVPYSYGAPTWWHIRGHHGSYYSAFYPNTFGTFFMLTPKADNTLNNRVVPDGDIAVGTPAYWTGITSGTAYNATYVTSAAGASEGVLRFKKTDASQTAAILSARPHPNAVSSLGFPNPGTRMYWGYVKFRVNSYVAIGGGYSGLGANSGGYLMMSVERVTSGDVSVTGGYQSRVRKIYGGTDWGEGVAIDMPYWASLTVGKWYENEDVMVVSRTNSSDLTYDYGVLQFKDSASNSGTQIEIDRFTLTDMGFVNARIGRGVQINTYASPGMGMVFDPAQLASPVEFTVGSSTIFIPSSGNAGIWNTLKDQWWPRGAKVFVGKPNSTAGACYVITESTSDFITIAGTYSRVHTLVLSGAGTAAAEITRTNTYDYLAQGYGLS